MTDNIYQRIHDTLTWKRIIGFNLILFLVLIVPISVRLAEEDTENRSSAAEEVPVVIPPPNYPALPPSIDRVSAFFGKTGDTVVILGSNFGDYQWGSKVYVGAVEAPKESIVRWSNNILEIKIPEGARSGAVYVVVNNQESRWEGSLLLYDVARSAQVGISKISSTQGRIYIVNASGARSGMIELSHVSEPLNVAALPGMIITGQAQSADSLGKKLKITFDLEIALTSNKAEIAEISYPGLGAVEIIRAELYSASGQLMPIFSDPLSVKLIP